MPTSVTRGMMTNRPRNTPCCIRSPTGLAAAVAVVPAAFLKTVNGAFVIRQAMRYGGKGKGKYNSRARAD